MRGLLADFKHALRVYRRTPGASLIAVIGFALAMAAVAAFVSLYVDLILRPHAGFEQAGRIVTFGWTDGQNAGGVSHELIERISSEVTSLEAAAGVSPSSFLIGAEREPVIGEMVTREFFVGLRPRLALGRGFEPAEHEIEGEPVVVISHRYWQEQFDGRGDVLGRTVEIRSQVAGPAPAAAQLAEEEGPLDFRIVGVMTEQFTGTIDPQQGTAVSFWIPVERGLPIQMGASADASALIRRISLITMRGLARRSSNVSAAAVAGELTDRYLDDLPDFTGRGARFEVIDGLVFNSVLQRNTEQQLRLFLAASFLIALVAAANVSLFLLARAPGRRRELGIRMAVGAPLKRVGRQLASEAAVLVAFAAAFGVALSVWFAQFLRGLTFLRDAQWRDVTLLDWRVLGLIGIFLLLLTALVSLAPILGLKKLGIAGSSRRVAARATVAQRIAGTTQIAMAVTLAGAAAAFSWHLGSLMLAHPGYETRNLHAATIVFTLRPDEGAQSAESRSIENARRREAILSLPSVTGASLSGAVPGLMVFGGGLAVPDLNDPTRQIQLRGTIVDAHYVDLLGLRLLHGRGPTDADVGVILVNQTLARTVWGRENVVGESLPISVAGGQRVDIVGVLEDLPFGHPADDAEPMLFATAINIYSPRSLALIESRQTSAELQRELQGLSESGAIELTISDVQPLKAVRGDLLAADSARSYLTIGGALLVVLLAVVGFYGTQRYLVRAGRREYAIRASLGAGPRALGRLVLQRGLLLALPGLALGLLPAFLLVAWLRDDFVSRDVSPLAVTMSVAVGFALLLTTSSFGPARQARKTQPAPLLRED